MIFLPLFRFVFLFNNLEYNFEIINLNFYFITYNITKSIFAKFKLYL
jgi:hypothetical protein